MADEEDATHDEVGLIVDADGMAVIGEPTAVDRVLRSAGLRDASMEIDLRRLKPWLGVASEAARSASEAVADSARWIKLTERSAELYKEHGLIPTSTPGVSWAMVGRPGKVGNWLDVEQGFGSVATNPAALSGLAGILAQVAQQQATAEITAYLAKIDLKVDDILRKHDDHVVSRMVGAGSVIEEAMSLREQMGTVNEVEWQTVAGTLETVNSTQAYALDQLEAIAKKLMTATKVGGLAQVAAQAEEEVREWLAVLARCCQLQGQFDVLRLERVLAVSPDEVSEYRIGLQRTRHERLGLIMRRTQILLERIGAACGTANEKVLWNWTSAQAVVDSSNKVAGGIQVFHELLGIESDPVTWERRRLDRPAELSAQAIQQTRDHGPKAVPALLFVLGVAVKRHRDAD